MTDGVFVPDAYGPNDSPYGVWHVSSFSTTSTWAQHSSCTSTCPWGSDYGAVVLAPLNGRTVRNVVGSVPVAFSRNNLTTSSVTAFGYPGDSPFVFGYLYYCNDPVFSFTPDNFGKVLLAQNVRDDAWFFGRPLGVWGILGIQCVGWV